MLRQAGTDPLCYKHGWPTQNSVLKVGEKEALLAPTDVVLPTCNSLAMIFQLQKYVIIKINYESLCNESFVVTGPTKVNIDFL